MTMKGAQGARLKYCEYILYSLVIVSACPWTMDACSTEIVRLTLVSLTLAILLGATIC